MHRAAPKGRSGSADILWSMEGDITSFETANDFYCGTLRRVRDDGLVVPAAKPTREIANFQAVLTRPLARVTDGLTPVTAVARFVWMVGGNDRLQDILHYEPRVSFFTDDQIVVPGSSYGRRLMQAAPGLDQIQGVIDRLAADPHSRRASAVIWIPEDAVRGSSLGAGSATEASRDIPCAFGLNFAVRDGALHPTLVMRSNNAVTLLPFNTFEFGLLAECIASELGVPVGSFTYTAFSMHAYETDLPRVETILNDEPTAGAPMPEMPAGSYKQARQLVRLEAKLRHAALGDLPAVIEEADTVDAYWRGFFDILLTHRHVRDGALEEAKAVAAQLPDWSRAKMEVWVAKQAEMIASPAASDAGASGQLELVEPLPRVQVSVNEADRTGQIAALVRACDRTTATAGMLAVSDEELHTLTVKFIDGADLPLAARSNEPYGLLGLEAEELQHEIERLRGLR